MNKSVYFERYAWKTPLFPEFEPSKDLGLIVIIPCYAETKLIRTLDSINDCLAPSQQVLIIVLINEAENSALEIQNTNLDTLSALCRYPSKYEMIFKHLKLSAKKAGVGLARKIAMDEAARFFNKINKDGIIINFDADCQCEPNYLMAIEKAFEDRTKAAIVFYEHPTNLAHSKEIKQYELYLRYYVDSLRLAKFPYAHQTLGSCILVKSSLYQKVGGMNTRKAGEDFYFLNKTIPHGNFKEINNTTIFPSDRISFRVPFGTGKSISNMKQKNEGLYRVYNPLIFQDLKTFFNLIDNYWNDGNETPPKSILEFLGDTWAQEINQLRDSVKSYKEFYKRFYQWFDAFRILKYVHYARDTFHPNIPLNKAIEILFSQLGLEYSNDEQQNLFVLRNYDRSLKQIK